eukprot:c13347_g1_i1.p1 GENE.c13347_g1_i1~~c13347_g1_i1.p1  ORF type:complete len:108 (+),score=13.65 c13347_g1_i1:582-905(+)
MSTVNTHNMWWIIFTLDSLRNHPLQIAVTARGEAEDKLRIGCIAIPIICTSVAGDQGDYHLTIACFDGVRWFGGSSPCEIVHPNHACRASLRLRAALTHRNTEMTCD